MKQTVLIGLGGTGSRAVNNVAKILREKSIEINDGKVVCVVLDTNENDNELINSSGTDIPVIATSESKDINAYLAEYAHLNPLKWCPYTDSFGKESMVSGASEMRVKSRLAFMDTMMTARKIQELEDNIGEIFHNKTDESEQVRVMLVSSLAGGTGSGMFIQTALWLRQYFEKKHCEVRIRGVLLLPDIFVKTVPNIRDNETKQHSLYANAYAAIRELNAINKISKGNITLERPMIIDGLFDSNNPLARPVFDNAFFIDAEDAAGVSFKALSTYEEIVAQIIYMQLYAPMESELVSVEDNLYKNFENSSEPVFGSCGTAKAEYPADNVAEYCALCAAKESISEGWNSIDKEIDKMISDQKAEEKRGAVITKPISRRDEFIKLFDEKSQKKGAEIGFGDKLLVQIKNHIFNEKHDQLQPGGEIITATTCKVGSFFEMLEEEINRKVTEVGNCGRIKKIGDNLPFNKMGAISDAEKKSLQTVAEEERRIVKKVIEEFDESSEAYADEIIRKIVPMQMGSINKDNECSVFGLFMKTDVNGNEFFVHPIAAKYLLYKLSRTIEEKQGTLLVEKNRSKAMKGDDKISFDIPKTRINENLDNYWKQVGPFINAKEIQHFIEKFKMYNESNALLCMQYESELLTQLVLKELNKYVKQLIEIIEKMFKNLPNLVKDLDEDIEKNLKISDGENSKIKYINASPELKNRKFLSLDIQIDGKNDEINKSIIEAIYGSMCAANDPEGVGNSAYKDKSVVVSLRDMTVSSYKALMKTEFKDSIYIDIIQALKEECEPAEKPANTEDDNPFEEPKSKKAELAFERKLKSTRDELIHKASPFLKARPDVELASKIGKDGIEIDGNNDIWMTAEDGTRIKAPIQIQLTFWGLNPALYSSYNFIDGLLGTNRATATSEGYGVNELYCYRSIYGVKAEAIDKFNEERGGDYYKYYSAIVNKMVNGGSIINTPHLDKTWHEFLPYVSASRRKLANQTFYKALWRGIAYGRIKLNANKKFQISELVEDSFGRVSARFKPLLNEGREVGATDVKGLIAALKATPEFEVTIAKQLQKQFEEDVRDMRNYIDTNIMKGLLSKGDLNPVTMMTRYLNARGADYYVYYDIIGGLSEVVLDIAKNYQADRSEEKTNEAKIKLCHRIYEASKLRKKNAAIEAWIEEFKSLKLPVANEEPDTDDFGSDDII